VPLGGVAISDEIFETFRDRVYPGGLTYSGHPLGVRGGGRDDQRDGLRSHGRQLPSASVPRSSVRRCVRLAQRHPSIGDVRGMGCFWAVELVQAIGTTKEPLAAYGGSSPEMNEVIAAMKSEGVLPFANFNRIHVVPPLNTPDEDVRFGLAVLDRALEIADRYVTE
jgi:taurine--2-oxoglutarate transaminase